MTTLRTTPGPRAETRGKVVGPAAVLEQAVSPLAAGRERERAERAVAVLLKAEWGITYTLSRASNPSNDEADAYERISAALDEALEYYNCHTNISRMLSITYVPSVQTADGNPTLLALRSQLHERSDGRVRPLESPAPGRRDSRGSRLPGLRRRYRASECGARRTWCDKTAG
jgi:hypothetical protein